MPFWGDAVYASEWLGVLWMQENGILRALIFNFFGGAHPQTPLVKLVQITHVKSWIHPCEFWEKYSSPRAIIRLLRLLTSHNIHFWSSIENFPLPVIHRVLKFLYLSFAQGIWWKLRNISQWRIILGCSKWTDCKLQLLLKNIYVLSSLVLLNLVPSGTGEHQSIGTFSCW